MAAQKQLSKPKYNLREKLAAITIGLASIVPVPNSTAINSPALASVGTGIVRQNVRQPIQASTVFTAEMDDLAQQGNIPAFPEVKKGEYAPYKKPIVSIAISSTGDEVWDKLASCESGENWQRNSGNGYFGGLQFSPGTWRAMGGQGLPSDSTREQQIEIAKALQARSGWGQWPACSTKLGLR